MTSEARGSTANADSTEPSPGTEAAYVEFSVDGEPRGRITSDLTVEYDGSWAPAVESYVETLEDEHLDDDAERAGRDVLEEILLGMPEETPVTYVAIQES